MSDGWRKTVVDRTTKQGVRVEVAVLIDLGSVWVESRVDGAQDSCAAGVNPAVSAEAKAKGYVAAVGRVAVTAAELAEVEAATAEAHAVRRASPSGLRSERERLALELAGLIEEEGDVQDAAWGREDEARAVLTPASVSAGIAAARKALRDFDAAHPEILTGIKAEENASAERHMWD